MPMIFALVVSVVIFLFVVDLVRREKLTFKYAFGWLIASFAAVLVTMFPKTIFSVSRWVGFEIPSNFVFFCILGVLVLLSLMMTIFLCQQNRRNEIMAQKIGILEKMLKDLQQKPGGQDGK
ncbi:MAG: DUF2304 domain-containing protein [Candidatus Omnitrophica bacterium]|nr:DUF2304 domain-containing protein [Candidatus Omnitrophota bacterium]